MGPGCSEALCEPRNVGLSRVRGIGSLCYLAYGLGQRDFTVPERELWAVVTFTVLASAVLMPFRLHTAGVSEEQIARIGPYPRGHGLHPLNSLQWLATNPLQAASGLQGAKGLVTLDCQR